MKHWRKWSFVLVFALDAVLAWGRVLSARDAVLVGGALELLGFVLGLRQVLAVVARYRQNRAAGLDWEAALEDGLATLLPRPVARLVAFEPRLWICLYQWIVRRRPLGADEFRYGKRSALGTMLALVVLTVPLEVLGYELIIPWATARLVLLLATVYLTLWMFGLYAAMQVLPYRLEADGLHLRFGLLARGFVPYSALAAVEVGRRKAPGEGLVAAPTEGAAYLAAGGRTDVTLRLNSPVTVEGLFKAVPPAATLYLAADDPPGLAQALRERAGLAAGARPPGLLQLQPVPALPERSQ